MDANTRFNDGRDTRAEAVNKGRFSNREFQNRFNENHREMMRIMDECHVMLDSLLLQSSRLTGMAMINSLDEMNLLEQVHVSDLGEKSVVAVSDSIFGCHSNFNSSSYNGLQNSDSSSFGCNQDIHVLNNQSHISLSHLPKMEFPKFDGSNPRSWMIRCDAYFKLMPNVSDYQKVDIASRHFEGRASSWYHTLNEDLENVSWSKFMELFSFRFRMVGSYEVYAEKFEEVSEFVTFGIDNDDGVMNWKEEKLSVHEELMSDCGMTKGAEVIGDELVSGNDDLVMVEDDSMESFLKVKADFGLQLVSEALHAGYNSDEQVYAVSKTAHAMMMEYDSNANLIIVKKIIEPILDHILTDYGLLNKDPIDEADRVEIREWHIAWQIELEVARSMHKGRSAWIALEVAASTPKAENRIWLIPWLNLGLVLNAQLLKENGDPLFTCWEAAGFIHSRGRECLQRRGNARGPEFNCNDLSLRLGLRGLVRGEVEREERD